MEQKQKDVESRYLSPLPFAVGIRRLQNIKIPDIEILVTLKSADDAIFLIQYEGFWSMFFAPHISGKLTYQATNKSMIVDYKLKPYGWRLPQMGIAVAIFVLLLIPALIAAGLQVLLGIILTPFVLFVVFYPFLKDSLFEEQSDKLIYYLNHILEVRDVTKRMDVWTGGR